VTDQEIMDALREPFPAEDVQFRPGATSGNRAMALAYIDARAVQERLDKVLGVAGWETHLVCLEDGSAVLALRVNINGTWVTKSDVAGPSDDNGVGNRRKAAVSGAIRRAASQLGIGRYLYGLPRQWSDIDPQKKTFIKKPTVPPQFLPKPKPTLKINPEELRQKALDILLPAAREGTAILERAWKVISPAMQKVALADLPQLKAVAAQVKETVKA
jgi:hypothetical protein